MVPVTAGTARDLDMAIMRNFPLHKLRERASLQLRFEGFKVFNNVRFANANINSSTFGTITSTLDTTGRILQLGAKVSL